MTDRQIIAQNITNLTDARYFAALGVQYLSFNAIPDSPYYLPLDKITEIKDWVEGPKCLIETNTLEFDEVADGLILSTIYSSLPLSKESFFRISLDELQKGLPDGHYIVKVDDESQLKEISKINSQKLIGLQLFLDISSIEITNINLLGDHGIAIQGGDEEAVGVKSFDDLDELFDLLQAG